MENNIENWSMLFYEIKILTNFPKYKKVQFKIKRSYKRKKNKKEKTTRSYIARGSMHGLSHARPSPFKFRRGVLQARIRRDINTPTLLSYVFFWDEPYWAMLIDFPFLFFLPGSSGFLTGVCHFILFILFFLSFIFLFTWGKIQKYFKKFMNISPVML